LGVQALALLVLIAVANGRERIDDGRECLSAFSSKDGKHYNKCTFFENTNLRWCRVVKGDYGRDWGLCNYCLNNTCPEGTICVQRHETRDHVCKTPTKVQCDVRVLNERKLGLSNVHYFSWAHVRGYDLFRNRPVDSEHGTCTGIPFFRVFANTDKQQDGTELARVVSVQILRRDDYWHYEEFYRLFPDNLLYPHTTHVRPGFRRWKNTTNFDPHKYYIANKKLYNYRGTTTDPNPKSLFNFAKTDESLTLTHKDPKCPIRVSIDILTREVTVKMPIYYTAAKDVAYQNQYNKGVCWK